MLIILLLFPDQCPVEYCGPNGHCEILAEKERICLWVMFNFILIEEGIFSLNIFGSTAGYGLYSTLVLS